MAIREILVDWVTASGGGKVSVFNFDSSAATAALQRSAIWGFLDTIDLYLDNGTTYSVRTEGREMDTITGALTGEWTDSVNLAGGGASAGESVADATQALVRWKTGVIVGGRFLQGRTFLPGYSIGAVIGGNLNATVLSNINAAAAALVATDRGFVVWHRPTSGSGGVFGEVAAGLAWKEFAVLRRRRG